MDGPPTDHDLLIELRTQMKEVRADIGRITDQLDSMSEALAGVPIRMESLELRREKSEYMLVTDMGNLKTQINGVQQALEEHMTASEKRSGKRIDRFMTAMLIVASLTGGTVAAAIAFLLRHG